MKYLLFSVLIILLSISAKAQINAVTESGKQVLLYPDSTWRYINDSDNVDVKLDTLTVTKSPNATFLVKGEKVKYGIWINTKKWSFEKNIKDGPEEYDFSLRNEDVSGMVIAERLQTTLVDLKNIAYENAKQAAPDIQIIKEGIRKVNGIDMYFMQMNGTIQGIKFTYYGYYYSGEKGSIQFLTYTSQNLLNQYQSEMESLLSGFVLL